MALKATNFLSSLSYDADLRRQEGREIERRDMQNVARHTIEASSSKALPCLGWLQIRRHNLFEKFDSNTVSIDSVMQHGQGCNANWAMGKSDSAGNMTDDSSEHTEEMAF